MINRSITKENLDAIYSETFDIEKFKNVDPCGLVYELLSHTDEQLDIELGALFVAMITWGNRKAIRQAARHMLEDEMKWHPGKFILSGAYEDSYCDAKNGCVYRTLNRDKFKEVCRNIHNALIGGIDHSKPITGKDSPTLEKFLEGKSCKECIEVLCSLLSPAKLGSIEKSACKRICMFMRWMTRTTSPDLGIWQERSQKDLYAVMDVHVCTLTNSILTHKNASWASCCELTEIFRSWDSEDPLKYDIALMTLSDRMDAEDKMAGDQ